MGYPTLMDDIRRFIAGSTDIIELPAAQAEILWTEVARRFVTDADSRWWWTSLREPCVSTDYGEADGIELLLNLIPGGELVRLAVTDDEHGPWPVLEAPIGNLAELLREQGPFEYFVVDLQYRWIVFDTHHNALVTAGTFAGQSITGQMAKHHTYGR